MQLRYCASVVLLLSIYTLSQDPGTGLTSTSAPFNGIKIALSKFDASASPQTVQLDFLNDSPNTITAWAYCIVAGKARDNDPSQGMCTMVDAVGVEVLRKVQETMTQKAIPGDIPNSRFIHPGQRRILSSSFALPVTSAEIQLKLVAYSDGTVETSGDQRSTDYFQQLLQERQFWLRSTQEVVDIGRKILADPTNPHPAQSMINELQNRSKTEPGMDSTLYFFKRPEWSHANNEEFVPADERAYLNKFVTEHEMQAAEFSKYLVRGVR